MSNIATRWLPSLSILRLLAVVALIVVGLAAFVRNGWLFDDAFMYVRYARNLRDGFGISWNPGGPPTYGLTSSLWLLVVLPFTFLPLEPAVALRLSSFLAGIGAILVMAIAVARHASWPALRSLPVAAVAVGIPLLISPKFVGNLNSGMDTALALLANAAVVLALLRYLAARTTGRALAVGLASFVAIASRPDSGLCALAAPFLAWAMLPGAKRFEHLLALTILPVALTGAQLIVNQWYYGVPLPLGFYAKSVNNHAGFQSSENALVYLIRATTWMIPYLGLLLAALRRDRLAYVIVFLLPLIGTLLYLTTVRQVMGFQSRFYLPCLPYLIVPTILVVDAEIVKNTARVVLGGALSIALLGTAYYLGQPYATRLATAHFERSVRAAPVPVPKLDIAATTPLLEIEYGRAVSAMSDKIARRLPPGVSMAASEVGELGIALRHGSLLDLVGLNDTRIGTRGFSMDYFIEQSPDLVWLPHDDYTGLRAQMLSDPRLFDRYVVIAGAFNYGVAIRKASRYRSRIEEIVGEAWREIYPAKNIEDYTVRRP